MAMFDYKNYNSAESAELVNTTHQLASYSSVTGVMGLPSEKVIQGLADVLDSTHIYPSHADVGLPTGWRELKPADLGLPEKALDFSGYYHIKSPLTGDFPTGPQAKILGEFNDAGQVTRISVAFAGTNSPIDVIDYFQMNEGTIAPNMEPLLNAVKNYATEHHIASEKVLVTGYSLGGGMTNIMARFKDTLAEGFFKDSVYIGHAAPTILDHADVLNMGYENDVVYRITGNEANVWDAIKAGKPGLVNPDKMFDSTVDNIVLFNDVYASPLWNLSPFSILNIPFGWAGHIDGLLTNAIDRITQSKFYEFTQRDSTVIVDNLSAFKRGYVWVEDKTAPTSDHHGTPAFIIGNQYDNLLKGGVGGDYIDAGAGNDKIKTGAGADRIDGGEGTDTLILDGHQQDWSVYRLSDGTHFFHSHNGNGLKEAQNIEQVTFDGELLSQTRPYTLGETGLQDHRFEWFHWLNHDKTYDGAQEGTSGNDTLSGTAVFARAGNDTLTALLSGSLLHGGEGDDVLYGNMGNDALYGAEGNDVLYAGGGQNLLNGGVGNDIFVFQEKNSQNTIEDFNAHPQEQDALQFSALIFADTANLATATQQQGSDVLVQYQDFSLTIQATTVAEVLQAASIIG